MKPINNWESVQAAGSYKTLPAGGYICEIRKVSEKPNRNTPGSHLELMIEISEGDYSGYFERDYRAQSGEDKFWRGVLNQNIPLEGSEKYESQCSFFKRFITNIEESNPGFHWAWDENSLKGKKCGVVFGERQKQSKKGSIYNTTYADSVVTVEDIRSGSFKIPELKKLQTAPTGAWQTFSSGSDDSDLPF